MNVTFVVNGQDLAPILSEFKVTHEIKYASVITTIDGTEHPVGMTSRDVIDFKLYTAIEGYREDYRALFNQVLTVEYDDSEVGRKTRQFRLDGSLAKKFEGKGAYGNIWSNQSIRLRCLEVDR